jgi:hypothetical protein
MDIELIEKFVFEKLKILKLFFKFFSKTGIFVGSIFLQADGQGFCFKVEVERVRARARRPGHNF